LETNREEARTYFHEDKEEQKRGCFRMINKILNTRNLFKLSLFLMLVDIVFTYYILQHPGFHELNDVIRNLFHMTPSGLFIFLWCPLVYIILKVMFVIFSLLRSIKCYNLILLFYVTASTYAITNNITQFSTVILNV